MKKIVMVLMVLLVGFTVVSCTSANRASWNLGRQAEEFKVLRRIAALNGFTNDPVFELIGYCSIETDEADLAGMLEITCKIDTDEYSKHFIYLADNVTVIVEQLEGIDVPQYHYQITFAPQALLPIPEIITGIVGD